MAKSLTRYSPNSNSNPNPNPIPIPNKYLGFGYKHLVFCRNIGGLMENMDKGLTVPKWVMKIWQKTPTIKCLKKFQSKMSA